MLLNSYISGMSGGDTWAIEIAKRLCRKKQINITIVTPKRAAEEWKKRGLSDCNYIVTTKEKEPEKLPLLYGKRILNFVTKKLNSCDEDIIFATSIFLPDVIPFLFLKGKKVAIFHMQAPHPICGYRNLLRKTQKWDLTVGNILNWINEKIMMQLLKLTDATMFVLPTTKEVVNSYGFSDGKMFTTTNGIDLAYINKIPEQKKEFDACWVGRPHPQKGVDDLIDIWGLVVQSNPKKTLVLMGADTETYKDRVIKKGLEKNIIIRGFVSDEEKFRTMKSSRLFLSTSYFESFHIAVMEAAACGLSIIAYDLPVYRQIYGDILHYVKLSEKKIFADQIKVLLENDSKREKDVKNMNEFILDFDWDTISEQVWNDLNIM